MKNKMYFRAVLLLIALIICSTASYNSVEAAGKISKKSLYLIKGQTYTLRIKGVSQKVKWSSGKKSVATVSSDGRIKAKKKGTAVIKAKVGKKTYKCTVKVYNSYSNKKLRSMIKKYYKAKGYTISPKVYIDFEKETGNTVTVHIYTIVSDGPNSGHTATWDWFDINRKTGKGTDTILYSTVDFTPYAN